MSANFTPDQKDYKNYKGFGSFKLFVLENFPFIEEDFDALTYYQMLCKVVGYLQDVITNNESLQYNQTELLDAFNELQNYVNTYFDNLDVQTEINNKLDQMAQDGTLQEIIAQYLQLAGILAYNTLNDMKNAENIVAGSFMKTFGYDYFNDKKGAFYKARNIKNTDIIDNINIIALKNENLVAELIKEEEYIKKSYGESDHLGVGNRTYTSPNSWTSTVNSIRANRESTQPEILKSSPSVFSPRNSKEASLYTGRDSVATFIANQSAPPFGKQENNNLIIYGENSVNYLDENIIEKIKIGMTIDTLHDNQFSGIITSIDKENKIIYIEDGWYNNGEKGIPQNGYGYEIGKIVKIWGSNKVVTLLNEFSQNLAVGEELGLNNLITDGRNKQIIGYDCVTQGTGNADIGFLARTGGKVFDSPGNIGKMERGFVAQGCVEGFETQSDNDDYFLLLSKNANGELTKNRFYITNDGRMTNPKIKSVNISSDGQIPNPEIRMWTFIPNQDINYTLPNLQSEENSYYNDRIYTFINRSNYNVNLSNDYVLKPFSSVTYYTKNVWIKISQT